MEVDLSYASAGIPPAARDGFDDDVLVALPLPDGRILYGGRFEHYNGVWANGLACLKPDGSLDTSFRSRRLSVTRIDCLKRTADGKILVGGYLNFYLPGFGEWRGIFRLHANGAIDTSFRSVSAEYVDEIMIEDDGKILVGAKFYTKNTNWSPVVRRLFPDGRIDSSFSCPIEYLGYRCQFVRTDKNTILVTACSYRNTRHSFLLINNDGSPRRKQWSSISKEVSLKDALLLPNGKVLLGGYSDRNGHRAPYLQLVDGNGEADPAFSSPLGDSGSIQGFLRGPSGAHYLFGSFWLRGDTTNHLLVKLDSTFAPDRSFRLSSLASKEAYTAATLSNGNLLLVPYREQKRNVVYHIQPDGSRDKQYHRMAGPDGPVYTLARESSGALLAGGSFRSIDGRAQAGLFRLRADGQPDTAFLPGGIQGDYVYVIANSGSGWLVGGNINQCRGRKVNGLLRLHADGSPDTTFEAALPAGSHVYALAQLPDGRICVGGWFGKDSLRRPLCRLLPNGAIDSSFDRGSGTDGYVSSLLTRADGSLIVGGTFTTVDGKPARRIFRVDADGIADTLFACEGGFDSTVNALLALPDGSILAGGNFRSFNGRRAYALARMNDNGWTLPLDTLSQEWIAHVQSLVPTKTGFRAGGYFRTLVRGGYGQSDRYVYYAQMPFSPEGTYLYTPVSSSGTAFDLLPDGDGFWAAGNFGEWKDAYRRYLVHYDSTGRPVTGLFRTPGPDKKINVLVAGEDGSTYIAGAFQQINGVAQPYFARLLRDGATDTSFHPDMPNGEVKKMVVLRDGKLLLSGDFTCIGDCSSNGLAQVDANGRLDPTFNAGYASDGDISCLLPLLSGKILVAGRFDHFNGKARRALARLLPDGRVDPTWRSNPCIDPRAADLLIREQGDGRILLNWRARCTEEPAPDRGGLLSQGDFINALYRLLPDGLTDTSFHAALDHNSHALAMELLPDGRILLAGKTEYYPRIFRLMPNGSRDTSFHFENEGDGAYSALALLPDGSFFASGTFTGYYSMNKITAVRYFLKDGSRPDRHENEKGTDPYDKINTLLWQNNSLLIGGSFTYYLDEAFNNIARLFIRPIFRY